MDETVFALEYEESEISGEEKYPGRYAGKEACRECATRCKSGDRHKTVSLGPDIKYVPVRIYGKTSKGLNPLPDEDPNPYNHTLDRWDYLKPETVIIAIKPYKTEGGFLIRNSISS